MDDEFGTLPVNHEAIKNIETNPIQGTFYRLIRRRYADRPLSMVGSLEEGGRYNVAGDFGALYLGFDQMTCEAEVSQGIAAGLPFRKGAFVFWSYDVALESVVRLDQENIRSEIGVTLEEITVPGDHQWASTIGAPLHERRVEGLAAPSVRIDGRCLDIYLDNLRESSHVEPLTMLRGWPTESSKE